MMNGATGKKSLAEAQLSVVGQAFRSLTTSALIATVLVTTALPSLQNIARADEAPIAAARTFDEKAVSARRDRILEDVIHLVDRQRVLLTAEEKKLVTELIAKLDFGNDPTAKPEIQALVAKIDSHFSKEPAKGAAIGLALAEAIDFERELDEPVKIDAIADAIDNPEAALDAIEAIELKAETTLLRRMRTLTRKQKVLGFGSAFVLGAGLVGVGMHYNPDFLNDHITGVANGGKSLIIFLTKDPVEMHSHIIRNYRMGLKLYHQDLVEWMQKRKQRIEKIPKVGAEVCRALLSK